MIVNVAGIERLVRQRISRHGDQQSRCVRRRLHVQHAQGLKNAVATLGKDFFESLCDLVTELQRLAIRRLLRSPVACLGPGMSRVL